MDKLMPKFKFENIVTIIGFIVALAMGWAQLNANTERLSDRVTVISDLQQQRITLAEAWKTATEGRLRAAETSLAGQSSDLRNIQSGINDIKQSIAELSRRSDKP